MEDLLSFVRSWLLLAEVDIASASFRWWGRNHHPRDYLAVVPPMGRTQ